MMDNDSWQLLRRLSEVLQKNSHVLSSGYFLFFFFLSIVADISLLSIKGSKLQNFCCIYIHSFLIVVFVTFCSDFQCMLI